MSTEICVGTWNLEKATWGELLQSLRTKPMENMAVAELKESLEEGAR